MLWNHCDPAALRYLFTNTLKSKFWDRKYRSRPTGVSNMPSGHICLFVWEGPGQISLSELPTTISQHTQKYNFVFMMWQNIESKYIWPICRTITLIHCAWQTSLHHVHLHHHKTENKTSVIILFWPTLMSYFLPQASFSICSNLRISFILIQALKYLK